MRVINRWKKDTPQLPLLLLLLLHPARLMWTYSFPKGSSFDFDSFLVFDTDNSNAQMLPHAFGRLFFSLSGSRNFSFVLPCSMDCVCV